MRLKFLYIFQLLAISVFLATGVEAQDNPEGLKQNSKETDELRASYEEMIDKSVTLREEYEKKRGEFEVEFEEAIAETETLLAELGSALDYGDPERRNEISEWEADLERGMDDLHRALDKITAASLVDLGNIPGRITDVIEDIKD